MVESTLIKYPATPLNTAPSKRSDSRKSPDTAPATKSRTRRLPNTLPWKATPQSHQILRLPHKVRLQGHQKTAKTKKSKIAQKNIGPPSTHKHPCIKSNILGPQSRPLVSPWREGWSPCWGALGALWWRFVTRSCLDHLSTWKNQGIPDHKGWPRVVDYWRSSGTGESKQRVMGHALDVFGPSSRKKVCRGAESTENLGELDHGPDSIMQITKPWQRDLVPDMLIRAAFFMSFLGGLGELMSLPFFNISARNSESWFQVGYGKRSFCCGFVEFGHVESSNCKCLWAIFFRSLGVCKQHHSLCCLLEIEELGRVGLPTRFWASGPSSVVARRSDSWNLFQNHGTMRNIKMQLQCSQAQYGQVKSTVQCGA